MNSSDFFLGLCQWENKLESMLDPSLSPKRAKNFLLSRMALQKALENYQIKVGLSELELINYHKLVNFSEIEVSLSHTSHSGAAVVFKPKETKIKAIGLDIEELSRKLPQNIDRRYRHPEDNSNLSPLELWCAKEAIYKSLYKFLPSSEKQLFSQIQVLGESFKCHNLDIDGIVELTQKNGLQIAIALIY